MGADAGSASFEVVPSGKLVTMVFGFAGEVDAGWAKGVALLVGQAVSLLEIGGKSLSLCSIS